MRRDKTIERNYIAKFKYLIDEYEKVKRKENLKYKTVTELMSANGTDRKTFAKYYNRYLQAGRDLTKLLPQVRGPRFKTRRPIKYVENKVIELRLNGNNKYEIHSILKPKLKKLTPSPSGVYNILKRYNLNVMNQKIKENKRRIIKERLGELGHIDCHYLNESIVKDYKKKLYLLTLMDDYSRIAWSTVVKDLTSVRVMFATLRCINMLNEQFGIKFEAIMSDNGPEFAARSIKSKINHPFEILMDELEIKHKYTRPYRPQTNGKVERFWRTIESDLIEGSEFNSLQELEDTLVEYLTYYNYERAHQGLNALSPVTFAKILLPN